MSNRSKYILVNNVFIKLISLNQDQGIRLYNALLNKDLLPPFTSNEFLFNYLAKDQKIINNTTLLTPGTVVMVSSNVHTIDEYQGYTYQQATEDVNMIPLDSYLSNMESYSKENKYIKTALIISKRMTGNYDEFVNLYGSNSKLFLDSMMHISYLYFIFQNTYKAVHGDPKVHNYTWLELDNPTDIIYDFRDEYNTSNNLIIRRKNVKHVFYLADLEFIYSPVVMNRNGLYFNFNTDVLWYGQTIDSDKMSYIMEGADDFDTTNNITNNITNDTIYVPKISSNAPYNYIYNLYGGYKYHVDNSKQNVSLYNTFNKVFPRMYSIDLLILIKMVLTYSYADMFEGDVLRKLHMHFSKFVSMSFIEENVNRRDSETYYDVSPASVAALLSS